MILPICMDDSELFPKNKRLAFPDKPAKFSADVFQQVIINYVTLTEQIDNKIAELITVN